SPWPGPATWSWWPARATRPARRSPASFTPSWTGTSWPRRSAPPSRAGCGDRVLPLTLAQVAAAVGGRLADTDGTPVVTGSVEFDSRKIAPGGLFVAIPGERVDGHDFAATAIRAGAAGVLAAREVGVPAVIVPPVIDPSAGAGNSRAYVLAGDADGSGAA